MKRFGVLMALVWSVSCKSVTNGEEVEDCHPLSRADKGTYIVGYGSLINTQSKNRTAQDTGPNIPVIIKGFSRNWNCRGGSVGMSTTYLGVDAEPDAQFNGVVFKIPGNDSLSAYDKRERFYCRTSVPYEDIEFLVNDTHGVELPSKEAEFWVYEVMAEYRKEPSKRYPIIQSYVDVFLSGCLEMEKTYSLQNFADKCVNTTHGWKHRWVNDRLFPRRPFVYQPMASKVDALIEKNLPGRIQNVALEGFEILYLSSSSPDTKSTISHTGVQLTTLLAILAVPKICT